jgi:isopenicillin N synthase-like dioxygenase
MAVFTGNGYRDVVNPHARVGEFSELPVIDLEPSYSDDVDERMRVAQQVREACTRVGFFYIKNTTMPEKVKAAAFQAVRPAANLCLSDASAWGAVTTITYACD